MIAINNPALIEQDICTRFITPAIEKAGWDKMLQMRQEYCSTAGRIRVCGSQARHEKGKKVDYILYYKPSIPLAVIEAKDSNHTVSLCLHSRLNSNRGARQYAGL